MVLFILKRNQLYSFTHYTRRSSGLWNSTRFIVEGLNANHIKSEIVEVQDNNSIDAMLAKYKPKVCVLEALWCVPEKFDVLKKLHPHVKFAVHMHSDLPFLALEGNSASWMRGYTERGVHIIANSTESFEAFKIILPKELVTYLPNVYISQPREAKRHHNNSRIHIASYGAIRPLKNQLVQAYAAIEFAKRHGKYLYFHVNGSRVEMGEQVLKSLVQLFDGCTHAELVQEDWMEPEVFIDHLASKIDIGMQVSFTETFNVVTADYVTAGIPIVTSKEIKWVSCFNQVPANNDVMEVVRIMERVVNSRALIKRNQRLLARHTCEATNNWVHWAKHMMSGHC